MRERFGGAAVFTPSACVRVTADGPAQRVRWGWVVEGWRARRPCRMCWLAGSRAFVVMPCSRCCKGETSQHLRRADG